MKKTNCGRAYCEAVQATQGRPWKSNWEEDTQPMSLGIFEASESVNAYLELARNFRIQMLEKARTLLAKAPSAVLKDDGEGDSYRYYRLADMDKLIEEIKANPDDDRFLKSQKSAIRKLADYNVRFDAANVKDYLRFQILVNNPDEIVLVRAALLNNPDLTSYKDQFRRPCEEGGHRAFKFHLRLDHEGQSMICEGQLGHRELEEYQLPKVLRSSERNLLEASRSSHSKSLRSIMQCAISAAADSTMHLRRAVNYDKCASLGLDQLLDSGINPAEELQLAIDMHHRNPEKAHDILGHSTSVASAIDVLGLSSRSLH